MGGGGVAGRMAWQKVEESTYVCTTIYSTHHDDDDDDTNDDLHAQLADLETWDTVRPSIVV